MSKLLIICIVLFASLPLVLTGSASSNPSPKPKPQPIIKTIPPIKPISSDIKPLQELPTIPTAPTPTPAPTPAPTASGDVQSIIIDAANRYGIDPNYLLSVARCESGFSLTAYNPSGATGLFQFMPATFYGNGGSNLYDAYDQANIAAKMFSEGQAHQWSCA